MDYLPMLKKQDNLKMIINQSLAILESVGIPIANLTPRRKEMLALCFMALAGIEKDMVAFQVSPQKRYLGSREIIRLLNEQYEENISMGSYDDIRRVHIKSLTLAGLVKVSGNNPEPATNDPTRKYTISDTFWKLLTHFDKQSWAEELELFTASHTRLGALLTRERNNHRIQANIAKDIQIWLSEGKHNELQRAVVERFLPRFTPSAELLYIGDTANKFVFVNQDKLSQLNAFTVSHGKLPDIIAYCENKNWLIIIEAVHSSGPINEFRLIELKMLLSDVMADCIFVTAFHTRADFRKWSSQIAWETEVWIAEAPQHLIHFNGDKFLCPHLPHTT
jgi:type II restriction enzyme